MYIYKLQRNIHRRVRLLASVAALSLLVACEKNPDIPQRHKGALSFCTTSILHKEYLRESNAPILLDDNQGLYFEERGTNLRPGPETYPSLISGSSEMAFPWAPFITVDAGNHRIGFYSGGESPRLLADTLVNVPLDGFGRLFLSDSLGYYHTTYVVEEGRAAPRQVRLRVFHFSPDAGDLEVRLNGGSLKSPLAYRGYSELLSVTVPDNRADTTLLLQFLKGESVLLRQSLKLKPGETGYMVVSGYREAVTFEDPRTGETIAVDASFQANAFKYN